MKKDEEKPKKHKKQFVPKMFQKDGWYANKILIGYSHIPDERWPFKKPDDKTRG